jgi:hypothetical protein
MVETLEIKATCKALIKERFNIEKNDWNTKLKDETQ